MSDQNKAVTLKEWANIAIAKHTSKIFKYETEVIKDKDPEDLHQMRVGMRRLRSAITGFAIALDLPAQVSEKNIGKIGRYLGKLRDLDVLLANLKDYYYPYLLGVFVSCPFNGQEHQNHHHHKKTKDTPCTSSIHKASNRRKRNLSLPYHTRDKR